jgi:hypothetical protein
MTDPDVEREIEANKARVRDVDPAEGDDGPIVDTLGTAVAPVTRGTVNDGDDAEDGRKGDDHRSLMQKARDAARTPD